MKKTNKFLIGLAVVLTSLLAIAATQQSDNSLPFKVGAVDTFTSVSGTLVRGTIKSVSGKWVLVGGAEASGNALWVNTDQAFSAGFGKDSE
jgi:hypothetical protein